MLRTFDLQGVEVRIPRFQFIGPRGGGDYQRIGIFAGIHGDEVEGTLSVYHLLKEFVGNPELARGYEIFFYPVCNPTGVEDGTRWSRSGKDLNREFWSNSREPEVLLLEEQLRALQFNGIISLHSDDTSNGLYGFVRGASLTRYVLEPALVAAESVLTRNYDKSIDNFIANNGIIEQGYAGVLSAPLTARPRPFEIVFETPQHAPIERQIEANVLAIKTVLEEYPKLISYANDI